jgi:hypothetical protein
MTTEWEDFTPQKTDSEWEDFKPSEAPPIDNAAETDLIARKYRKTPMEDAESNRLGISAREGFRGTFAGLFGTAGASGFAERQLLKDIQDNPQMYKGMKSQDIDDLENLAESKRLKWSAQRRKELEEFYALPNWYDDPAFGSRMWKLMQSGLGQVAGGLPSPENFIPVGRGSTALRTFGRGAMVNAPLGGYSNLIDQQLLAEAGLQKDIDWDSVATGFGVGGAVGGAFNAAGHHGHIFPTGEPSAAEQALAQQVKNLKEKSQTTVPTVEEKPAEPPVVGTLPTDGEPVWEKFQPARDTMKDLPTDELPGPPLDYPTDIPKPDQFTLANEQALHNVPDDTVPINRVSNNVEANPEGFPKIEKGFGPDLTWEDVPLRGNKHGILPGALAEEANVDGMQGTHQMDFEGITKAMKAMETFTKTGRIEDHPGWKEDIGKASTGSQALDAVIKWADHPELKEAATFLKQFNEDTVFNVATMGSHAALKDVLGLFNVSNKSGRKSMWATLDKGVSPETIVHEARHAATSDAHNIALDEQLRQLPHLQKYVNYSDEVEAIRKRFAESMESGDFFDKYEPNPKNTDHLSEKEMWHDIEYAKTNREEFDSQAASIPHIRDIMRAIDAKDLNLWDRFMNNVYKFFGAEKNLKFRDLLDRFMYNEAKLPDLQIGDRAVRKWIANRALGMMKRLPDMKDTAEAIGIPEKLTDEWAKKVAAANGRFKTPEELELYLQNHEIKDLHWGAGNLVTQGALAKFAVDNPVVSFVYHYLFDAWRSKEARLAGYDRLTEPSLKWARANSTEAVNFLRDWEAHNAKPELRPQIEEAAAGGTPGLFDLFVTKLGHAPGTFEQMHNLMQTLGHVHEADNGLLLQFGRQLDHVGGYFPLSRNQGPFHLTVTDDKGNFRFAKGYKSLAEAKQAQEALRAAAEPGYTVSEVIHSDPTRILNSAMQEAVMNGSPEWLFKAAMDQFKRRQEYVRNFELGREASLEIGGYIGEVAPTSKKDFGDMLERYLEAFSKRIAESGSLEEAAAAMKVSNSLLLDQTVLHLKYPNTYAWLHNIIARQMGLDVSGFKPLDRLIQHNVMKVGKALTELDSLFGLRYKAGKEDNILSNAAAKEAARWWTAFVSMVKIGLSTPILATNAVQPATLPGEGLRVALHHNVNPSVALYASAKMAMYMATLGKHPAFEHIREKMLQAKNEGVIDPRGREDFSLAQNVDRNVHSVTDAYDRLGTTVYKGFSYLRDKIEKMTNYMGILYFHFFAEKAWPDMDPHLRDRMVYGFTRDYAGDYSRFGAPLIYDHAGTVGQLGSNFAKWKHTRVGRYQVDIGTLARMKRYGPKAALPFVASLIMAGTLGGALGEFGGTDYEAVRRWMGKFGVQMKPLSLYLSESRVYKAMPGWGKTWLERGALTALSDLTAQHFGEKSGPDFSPSLRESSLLEAQTVSLSYAADVIGDAGTGLKQLMSTRMVTDYFDKMPEGSMFKEMFAASTSGVGSDEAKMGGKFLPNAMQELYRSQFVKHMKEDGKDVYIVPQATKDEGMFKRDKFQQMLALAGGIKTTEENRAMEGISADKYITKTEAAQLTRLKEGVMNNLDDPWRVDRNAKEILGKYGKTALEGLVKEIEQQQEIKGNLDYFDLKKLSIMKKKDAVDAQRTLNQLNRALGVARPQTSSGH